MREEKVYQAFSWKTGLLPPHTHTYTHTFSKPRMGPTPKHSLLLRTSLKTQCCLRVCKNNSPLPA